MYIRDLALENGFKKQIILKLIRKQRKTRKIHSIKKDRDWKIKQITYTGNETSKISKLLKKADTNISISFKTNKLNNILNNKVENFNIYESKGIYQLTCVNCEKFYIGRTKGILMLLIYKI